ncbi:hypothetical protein [Methylocystis sp. ATCC 49242]|uniref:phosphoribosyltransferase-like protein n=1 Tax=Methylocystis sp. ATCC 49242 TaxID=622637 RepID=UPI0001F873F5|nr:hypothetical protein [Methylocystis sp. ATCC 49242]
MKEELAQSLLALVMDWKEDRVVEELPHLDRMARFKYDEYQQFGPGQKFLEALCLWLKQFGSNAERETAYAFVRDRVVFISAADMRHLVETSFPDVIRPSLIADAAGGIGTAPYRVTEVIRHAAYARALRQTLFLGLSDGSRMDIFRRAAALDNEQVWQAYEISKPKSAGMLKDLRVALGDKDAQFTRIVLIDDFSASGISYIRKEGDEWKGKLVKALKQFQPNKDASCLIKYAEIKMHIVLYVATKAAVGYISEELADYCAEQSIPVPDITAVYELSPGMALDYARDGDFLKLIDGDSYYRTRPLDEHEAKGGTDTMKRGFAACALPLVLAHNCPNNSIYLLWADPLEKGSARGLFPRIVRHREVA